MYATCSVVLRCRPAAVRPRCRGKGLGVLLRLCCVSCHPAGVSRSSALVFHVVLDKHVGAVTFMMNVLAVDEEERAFPAVGNRVRVAHDDDL
jgi:hypothetical protein